MVHFLPELITLNYCEGPYMTPGLPKFSHGLHQKISSLNGDSYQTLNSAGFPLGTVPTSMQHPSGSHLLLMHRHPPNLQGEEPHCPQWCKTKDSLLLHSNAFRKQS